MFSYLHFKLLTIKDHLTNWNKYLKNSWLQAANASAMAAMPQMAQMAYQMAPQRRKAQNISGGQVGLQ